MCVCSVFKKGFPTCQRPSEKAQESFGHKKQMWDLWGWICVFGRFSDNLKPAVSYGRGPNCWRVPIGQKTADFCQTHIRLPALDLSGAAKNQPHVVLRLGAIGCKICSKKQNEHLLCVQGTSRGKPHLPSVWWFCPQLNVLNEKREGQWCNFWMSQLQRQEPTINHGGTGRRKRRN